MENWNTKEEKLDQQIESLFATKHTTEKEKSTISPIALGDVDFSVEVTPEERAIQKEAIKNFIHLKRKSKNGKEFMENFFEHVEYVSLISSNNN